MPCNCNKAINLPCCISSLIIGAVPDASESYYVYFKTPDGSVKQYAAVGLLYAELLSVDSPELRIGTNYEVWVTKAADNMNERRPFTPVGATDSVTCVTVQFDYCSGDFTSQEITLL